jgi:hypothetical protein
MRLRGSGFADHHESQNQQREQKAARSGKEDREHVPGRMFVMVVILMTGGCELFLGHLRAVLVVGMTVGGVHGLFEADTAFAGKASA